MPLNRRNFLKVIPASLLTGSLFSCTHKKFFNPDEDILLSGGGYDEENSRQHALIIINLTQKEKRLVETPFMPHGIYIHPNNKYRVLCFEKNGENSCEIDLQTREITRLFHSAQNQLFSGHASFSHDGKIIYCIESNKDNLQGSITIRDTDNFNVTRQLPTLGLSPHDCHLTKDNILITGNTGKSASGFHQPALVRIDMNTEKLVERIKLDDQTLNCGHLKITDDNALVITSAPNDINDRNLTGGVSIRLAGENVTTMVKPELVINRMTGEALSIDINRQQDISAITHPDANLLTFWSIKGKKIVKAFGIESPRGISQTLDGKNFIVSYGEKPAMAKISTRELEPQADSIVQPTLASGEHMINWSKTLREIMPARVYD